MKLAMHIDKVKSPHNESYGNLNSHVFPENLLPCISKASITIFDATSQRISVLISLLWCGIIFTTIVVATCKLFCKNKGDGSEVLQHNFSHRSGSNRYCTESCTQLTGSLISWSLKFVVHQHHAKLTVFSQK